jgi:hypothetical protein
MNKMEYAEYRETPHWQRKRRETLETTGGLCKWCQAPADDCHHTTYRNLWHEVPGVDTIPLCRPCHEHVHGRSSRDSKPEVELCRDCQVAEATVCDHPCGHWVCVPCLKWRRFTG